MAGATANATPGSTSWSKAFRASAVALVREMETSYLRLAEVLLDAYTTRVDNEPNGPPVYTSWGFGTWEEWVGAELGLNPHKARNLRLIGHRLRLILGGMSAEPSVQESIRSRIGALGWTKAREVLRVATSATIDHWIGLASQSSFYDIEATVRTHLKAVAELHAAQSVVPELPDQSSSPTTDADESGESGASGSLPPPPQTVTYAAPVPPSKPHAQPLASGNPLNLVPPPPDTAHLAVSRVAFHLYPDQKKLVDEAIERSKQASGSAKPGHNLSLVAMHYLATAGFTLAENARADLLRSVAESLGVRVLAVTTEGEVVLDTLHGLLPQG